MLLFFINYFTYHCLSTNKVFQVGNVERIPAHKYILATGSSVFFTMFYGGLPEMKDDIEVSDVEPSAFLTLLR